MTRHMIVEIILLIFCTITVVAAYAWLLVDAAGWRKGEKNAERVPSKSKVLNIK